MTPDTVPDYRDPLRWVAYIMGLRLGWEWHRWVNTGDSDTGRRPDTDPCWFRCAEFTSGFRHGWKARARYQHPDRCTWSSRDEGTT